MTVPATQINYVDRPTSAAMRRLAQGAGLAAGRELGTAHLQAGVDIGALAAAPELMDLSA